MTAEGENIDLYPEAELAAQGDDDALDKLFAALGGSAWGVGFAAADAVGPATDSVAKGFAELLQLFDNGLSVGDVRTELLRSTRAAALEAPRPAAAMDYEAVHDREPLSLLGETKDRQATLAFAALSEKMRSAVWLVEAEGFTITRAAQLLGETHKATEELVRQARSNFRSYYVDAVKRDAMSPACTTTLDKLAAYVGRSLPAGEVAAVEHHLADCKECRSIVMKLDDLESRLHAAIPPVPAWTRQQVADTWSAYVPVVAGDAKQEPEVGTAKRARLGALIGFAAVAAAFLIVALGTGVFSSDHTSTNEAVSNSPTTVNGAVATPEPSAAPTTLPAAATTTSMPVATTTTTRAPTTTSAPRRITPTTTRPTPTTQATTDYTLVDLAPTPISN